MNNNGCEIVCLKQEVVVSRYPKNVATRTCMKTTYPDNLSCKGLTTEASLFTFVPSFWISPFPLIQQPRKIYPGHHRPIDDHILSGPASSTLPLQSHTDPKAAALNSRAKLMQETDAARGSAYLKSSAIQGSCNGEHPSTLPAQSMLRQLFRLCTHFWEPLQGYRRPRLRLREDSSLCPRLWRDSRAYEFVEN